MNVALELEGFVGENSINKVLKYLRDTGWLPKKSLKTDLSACLLTLIKELALPVKLNRLSEILPYKAEYIGVVDVLNAMVELGYIGRAVKLRICDMDKRLLPCLFIPDEVYQNKYTSLVVTKNKNEDNKYSVFTNNNEVIYFDSNARVGGVAYFFTKKENIEDIASESVRRVSGFSWFRSLLERFRGLFARALILSVALGMVSIAAPIFVMLVYDKVITEHSLNTLLPLTIGACLALLMEWGVRGLRTRSLAWISSRLDNIVSNKIFEKLMMLPPIFIERASVSSQISRLKAFDAVREFFSSALFLAIVELPFTLIILLAIALIAGKLALIPFLAAMLYTAVFFWFRQRLKTAIKLAGKASSDRQQIIVETFEKMHTLRGCGMTSSWFQLFHEHSGKASLAGFRAGFLASIVESIAHGIFILSGLITIVWGIDLVWENNITTGTLIATIILVWRVLTPFQIFCTSISRLEQIQNAIDQINRLMEIETERDVEKVKSRLSDLKGQISFSKVGLRYTRELDPIFSGLSFQVEPGQVVAIVGVNGSGKSTILKLANGLYQPQAGTVRVDGIDIRQLDPIELRQNIAYVPQTPSFFQGTIAENLRLSDALASDESLRDALQEVDAWEEVCKLPKGIETQIGKNNAGLQTGLAYKLNLARALIKTTPIMLIDELPYVLLNGSAGKAYHRLLNKWRGQRTIVLVTHREDYLRMANVAILLREGGVPFVSTPDEIIKEMNKRSY